MNLKQIKKYGTFVSNIHSFSKSKGETLASGDSYMDFTFEGTGFDFFVNNTAYYSIDGSANKAVVSAGLISVRGLQYGTHTVRISRGNPVVYVDYLDVYQ